MGIYGLDFYKRTITALPPPGSRTRTAGYDSRTPAVNPMLAMIFTALVGGTASDGTYSITVKDDVTGIEYVASFLRADSETSAQIAAALAADWNGKSKNNDIFTAAAPAATITFTGKVTGRTFTVTKVAPGTGTITLTTTQTAGGQKLPPGTFVARLASGSSDGVTPDTIRRLKSGDAIGKVWGFLERMQIMGEIRPETVDVAETYKPGDAPPVMRMGHFAVLSETAFNADTDTPYIRITDGGDYEAIIRNDADGGDAIDASSIIKVISSTAAAGTVEIHLDIKP